MKVLLLCVLALSVLALSSGEVLDLEITRGRNFEEISEANAATNLPGVSEFARGIDYSTGQRKTLSLFAFTYTKSESGDQDFLYDDNIQGLTYRIPDQLAAANWVSECSTEVNAVSRESSSVSEYLESITTGSSTSFDQKSDITVSVPVGPAEVSGSTEVRNVLGYGTSRGSEEYRYQMRSGESITIDVKHTAALWTVQWRLYDESTNGEIRPTQYLSSDFSGSIQNLKSTCSMTPPDREGRLEGGILSRTACDNAATALVNNFGTHYNNVGRFGGLISQNYYYNSEATSSKQREISQEYSKYEFGLLFFNSGQVSQEQEALYQENNMEKSVTSGQERIYGGDASSASPGSWCNSVRRQPAIITDTKVIAISDLIDDADSKFAVKMAIMDAWVCNGGTAINYDESEGIVQCQCPSDHEYELDELCLPKKPKCYDLDIEVPCQFGKIIAEYTPSYSLAWKDSGSGGEHDGSLFTPNPLPGYQLVGSIAQKGYGTPTDPVIVIEPSTPEYLATAATSYTKTYADTGTGSSLDGSVWRPVCPDGYASVSDFGQRGYDWPSPMYSDIEIRPCIAKRCLKVCVPEWVWDDTDTGGDQDIAFWRLAGGDPRLGSSVGNGGGFFRTTHHWTVTPKPELLYCIKPECVVEA